MPPPFLYFGIVHVQRANQRGRGVRWPDIDKHDLPVGHQAINGPLDFRDDVRFLGGLGLNGKRRSRPSSESFSGWQRFDQDGNLRQSPTLNDAGILALPRGCDEALAIAQADALQAYRDLSGYRIELALETDGWRINYQLKDLRLDRPMCLPTRMNDVHLVTISQCRARIGYIGFPASDGSPIRDSRFFDRRVAYLLREKSRSRASFRAEGRKEAEGANCRPKRD